MQRQGNMPRALLTGDVVKNRPGDAWLAVLDEGIKPKFATVFAELYLKVNEEEKAFPYIEKLAATHPRQAKELAEEFLRTWTKNHDPNSQQMRRSRFFYVYGFEIARRGHSADAIQAGAEHRRAGRMGQEAAEAADRRARREAAHRGLHRLPQLGRGLPAGRDQPGLRLVRRPQAADTGRADPADARQPGRRLAAAGRAGEAEDQAAREGHPRRGAARLRGGPRRRRPRVGEVSRPLGSGPGPGGDPARREQLPPGDREIAAVRPPAAAGVRRVPEGGPALRRGGAGPARRTSRTRRSSSSGSRPAWAPAISQHITEETLADHRQPPLIRQSIVEPQGRGSRAAHEPSSPTRSSPG